MKRHLVLLCAVLSISCLIFSALPAVARVNREAMPPNEFGLARMLIKRGVIPADASEEQILSAVKAYVSQKLGQKPEDRPHPIAARELRAREQGLRGKWFHGKKPVNGAHPLPNIPNPAVDNILVLLVEFTDPVHNAMPEPDRAVDNTTYWEPNFDQAHYNRMLFARTPGVKSMANYYLEQSDGKYTVTGEAAGWIQVPFPESEYGADAATGEDNAHGPVWRVVRDAVAAAGTTIDWAKYDEEDPYDLDGDGLAAEPDGYVDHIMVVHAGAGQEGGGGAEGDDAIWSHSWFADYGSTAGPGLGGVPTADPNVWVGAYTIMPEDGTIGVFCHEFGHDLGLPDEYDTVYSGEASTAFWSLMASGSWLGRPLGVEPSDMSVWAKLALGWLDKKDIVVLNTNSKPARVQLTAVELKTNKPKAIRYNLPAKDVTTVINTPASGANEWYSGTGNDINNTLVRSFDLSGVSSALLTFKAWYEIEEGWDYGAVEVSNDGGANWTTVAGNITTEDDPYGQNPGYGITGTSNGWVDAAFDLSPFAGQNVLLRFRYWTDGAVAETGWTIDDLAILAIGFADDVEGGVNGWAANGWKITSGTMNEQFNHYYIGEWRTFTGFDASLQYAYNFLDAALGTAEWYSYNPGLLLWYRDMQYTDNWVGVHPGHGFLLAVDSHPEPLLNVRGGAFRNRIQIADAPFGLNDTIENKLTAYGTTLTYPSLPAVPVFDDAEPYWNPLKPDNSVIVPTLGVQFKVVGQAADLTTAMIEVLKK